jgi:hypothetical protein
VHRGGQLPLGDFLMRYEADLGTGVEQQRDQQAGQRARQPATVHLGEAWRIGKPG